MVAYIENKKSDGEKKFIVSKNIKKLRKLYKQTQTDLANAIGTTKSHISEYEKGVRIVSDKTIVKIAENYMISKKVLTEEFIDSDFQWSETIGGIDLQKYKFLLFPVFCAKDNIEDSFAQGIDKHKKLLENFCADDAHLALCYYKTSWENSNNYYAIANYLSLLLYSYLLRMVDFMEIKMPYLTHVKYLNIADFSRRLIQLKDKKGYWKDLCFDAEKHEEIKEYVSILKTSSVSDGIKDFAEYFDFIRFCYGLVPENIDVLEASEIIGAKLDMLVDSENLFAYRFFDVFSLMLDLK